MYNKLEPCPKCQSEAVLISSPAGTKRDRHMEYGVCCSNKDCSWNYAYTSYRYQEQAAIEWNKKCRWQKMLDEESERLNPCSCGGKARLVFEHWGYNAAGWFARCESCGKLMTAAECREAIINAWNRRNDAKNN